MGGMPALKQVILYPKEVSRIALLAPAQQVETYTSTQIKYFREVKLKVWHGTADMNVPYWVTEELVTYFKKNNTPIEVVTLKGKIHWDVDTEYMKDVYEWFTK
jgi:predicted esterase